MAAAEFPQEEFDDEFLTCDVCKDIFEDPRVLPCLHTFCAKCLGKWREGKGKFTCPSCRQQVSLQGADASSLPANFYVKKLLNFRALQKSKKTRTSCGMCESPASIEGTCGDCQLLLCGNCMVSHRNSPALKDHSIITLDDLKNPSSRKKYTRTEYCPKHKETRMSFFCQPCAKLVCQACAVDEHRPGPNHDPRDISSVANKVKGELQTLVGEAQDRNNTLQKIEGSITKDVSSITTNCEQEKKKIQEHFAQLRAKLDEEEEKLTKKLEEMGKSQKEPLLKELKGLEGSRKTTEEGLKFCMDTLARDNDVEILTLRQQIKDRLNRIGGTDISHKQLKDQISFQPNSEMFTSSLGSPSFCSASIVFTELPVESLPTTVIFRPQEGQVQGAPQVTVTSPGGQRVRLHAKEMGKGMFEAIWRPQTSGMHVVGVITGEGGAGRGGGDTGGGVGATDGKNNLCSQITVDVGSNNPVLRFGQKGSQQGQFDSPMDVAVRGDRLYVADTNNQRVQVFDMSGNFCSSFSTVAYTVSVAVQTDGTIVVNSGQEVKKFSPSGELTNRFPLGEYCTSPYGLAVQRDGRVVVADDDKHSIFLFEAGGTLVKQVGGLEEEEGEEGEGQFDDPSFVCVDKEDNIIVTDIGNDRVQVFDKNLNFQHKFGQKGRHPQDMWGPAGVSADSRGNIVLANLGEESDTGGVEHGKKLQVFCPEGTWVSTISSDGDKLNLPHGVAVTEDGHVFVADTEDHCIRKYRYM